MMKVSSSQVSENKECNDFPSERSFAHLPSKLRLLDDYRYVETLKGSSCHEVSRYEYINSNDITVYFFKKNDSGSIGPTLEAISADFSALIAPEYTASTHVVYDSDCKNVGVMSEEILDFKPSSLDGLRECDLEPSVLDKVPISELERLYHDYQIIQNDLTRLLREERKIDFDRVNISRNMEIALSRFASCETMQPCPPLEERQDINDVGKSADKMLSETRFNIMAKLANYKLRTKSLHALDAFYLNIFQKYSITKKNFDTYLILRGHANAFVSAILGQDADFHRNNFTKYGMRFDFDMTMWPVLYKYKQSNLKVFRSPDEGMFRLSMYDVIHFPNIRDAQPFYWPTWTAPVLSVACFEKIRPYLNFSANAYSEKDTLLYRKLENNTIFKYHKYATMFRYILTTDDMYNKIIASHFSHEIFSDDLMQFVLGCQNRLRNHMEDLLTRLPDFHDYFVEFGRVELEKFIGGLLNSKFDIDQIRKKFESLQMQFEKNKFNDSEICIVELLDPDERLNQNEQRVQPLSDVSDPLGFTIQDIQDINDIKKLIMNKMQGYIDDASLSFVRVFGFFRHNVPIAREIIDYCSHPDTDTGHPEQNIRASHHLYQFLLKKKESIQPGLMLDIIEILLTHIEGSLEYAQYDKVLPSISA